MDYLYEALDGTAIRYAAEKRNLAESIAELREIANGRDDILAEAVGITAGSWYASPATHVGHELIAAGVLILAGGGAGRPPDDVELERRSRVGFRGALIPTSVPEWGTATAATTRRYTLAYQLPESSLPVETTMLGRNRRASKRPCGYSSGNGRCGQQVDDGNVEKRPGRHLKVGHLISVLKTRHVGPILLRDARSHLLGSRVHEPYIPAECARKNLLQISSIVAHHFPVRERDPNRGNPSSEFRRLGVGRPKVKEVAPVPRILGPADLPGGRVDDSELPIAEQPTVGNLGGLTSSPSSTSPDTAKRHKPNQPGFVPPRTTSPRSA